MPDRPPLLEVENLSVEFKGRHRTVRAVSDVSFSIGAGETLGLVGESGSGKTTIGRAILGLVEAKAGAIRFEGRPLDAVGKGERRNDVEALRAVFQDPYSSLNPSLRIATSLLEGTPRRGPGRREAEARMTTLLQRVGLSAAAAEQYPGRFSGGQRQRLAIARALMSSPRLVICDEAVSALDVSVQAQVLNLLRELQRESSLGYLFIGHDLDVVRYMSDRIIVLYHGHVLEEGPAAQVARRPRNPYTQALVAASPQVRAGAKPDPARGAVAAAAAGTPEEGCPFALRCPLAVDVCRTERPPLEPAPGGGKVACHRYVPEADELDQASSRSHKVGR